MIRVAISIKTVARFLMLGIPKKHLKCLDTAQFKTAFNPFWPPLIHDEMADR